MPQVESLGVDSLLVINLQKTRLRAQVLRRSAAHARSALHVRACVHREPREPPTAPPERCAHSPRLPAPWWSRAI